MSGSSRTFAVAFAVTFVVSACGSATLRPDGGAGSGGKGGSGGSGGRGGTGGLKADGQPCSAASECATGVCGGRCCAAGCTCTLPSASNLLKDPGIDVDVSNWTASIGAITKSAFDAQKCPYSGSLAATADAEQVVTQCVRNTPLVGDFNFGAQFRFDSTGAPLTAPICQVSFNSGFNCDADIVLQNETGAATGTGDWQTVSATLPGVTGANSVAFSCYLFLSTGATFYLDMLYVSKTPGTF